MKVYHRQSKRGYYIVDDKMIYCDSQMEATILTRLVREGFSGKWRRAKGGLSYGFARYTPDAELCILHDSMNRRALVEFKSQSVTEFDVKSRSRMLASPQ